VSGVGSTQGESYKSNRHFSDFNKCLPLTAEQSFGHLELKIVNSGLDKVIMLLLVTGNMVKGFM